MAMTMYFDMDGTLFDLYGVEDWLPMLEAKDPTPYKIAEPLIRFSTFARLINAVQRKGIKIGVISWLAKNSTPEYDLAVTTAKMEALKRRLPSVKWDYIHIIPYGTPKYEYATDEDILFDDEDKNRMEWEGTSFDEKNIVNILKIVLDKRFEV